MWRACMSQQTRQAYGHSLFPEEHVYFHLDPLTELSQVAALASLGGRDVHTATGQSEQEGFGGAGVDHTGQGGEGWNSGS